MRIFSKLPQESRLFYSFSGVHSFLIGLFPFFIPVFLWKNGFTLAQISLFIAITAICFCLTLRLWERLFHAVSLDNIILLSFLLETLLFSTFFFQEKSQFLVGAAAINGMYNCLFWIPQRMLFLETITLQNSGRQFGNLQIFVFLLLKAGIFAGGMLLERDHFIALYLMTIAANILAIVYFLVPNKRGARKEIFPKGYCPMSIKDILHWQDASCSKTVFSLDGIFLYLESYFWSLSLFLVVKENFQSMALLVVLLAVCFGAIFWMLKNNIDRLNRQLVYGISVILYLLSWLLRGVVTQVGMGPGVSSITPGIILVMITFFTGFFRLSFNKRFFDHALRRNALKYILVKSYYSQFFIALFFVFLSRVYGNREAIEFLLQTTYWPLAFLSLIYLTYCQNTHNREKTNPTT